MKKILIGLSTFSLLVSSSSIVSCTITYQFKNNYLDQIKLLLNTSAIASQSIILSDKNTTNISTDYSLKTFSQTKISDLYKNQEKELVDKYIIDKKLTYEYQFKSMFLTLEKQDWTNKLKQVALLEKDKNTNLDLNWNDQTTRTTENNTFKTLSLISAGINFLFSGDFTANQQGNLINNFLSNQSALLESTVFNNNKFTNFTEQLNKIEDNKFYNIANSLFSQPDWFTNSNNNNNNNLAQKTLKEILEFSSQKLWDQILPKDNKQDLKIDWSKLIKPLIDLLKAFSIYQNLIEQKSDKTLNYSTMQPLYLFSKEKTNSEFLYEILQTDLQTIYKDKTEEQIKQEINSIDLKKIITSLKNSLVFEKEDKYGYKFQKFIVMLLGSSSEVEQKNNITNNFLISPFYKWYEQKNNKELLKKIIIEKLNKIEKIKPFASIISNYVPILFEIIKAFHQDLVEQGVNNKLKTELNKYLSLAKVILPSLGVDKKVIEFLDSKALKDFLNNCFLALYNQDFLKEVFILINQLSDKQVFNNQIIDNILTFYNLTSLKLDKFLDYLLSLIKKPINGKNSFDEFQFLYGLKDLSISQIIKNLENFYNKDDLSYIFNLDNFKNLLDVIFNKNITSSFKYNKEQLETKNALSTILTLLALNPNKVENLKINITSDNNKISDSVNKQIQEKQYGLASVILLGYNNDKKAFYENSILDNVSNLFGHSQKDLNKEASKNAINVLIKSYLELINWFQNTSIKKYAKDNFDVYLDQNNWTIELIDQKGNIDNLNETLTINYMLKFKNLNNNKQNWTYKVSLIRTSNSNQPWKIAQITKLNNNK
ncbi:MOLPALP family lipoprotein [Mycoplasma capricolum subsp. capripneumoniae]|uniref:MOLPALP family lipoprotein n=1 Tax=Mycoplasma capricolum TaxID=2095 RepID=UPI0004E7DE6D|nr:MOLPALP family lipoprotein [Mycoplasma capricolum]QIN48640.1 MOLPALP family lipoprotein [Mycoplasma capricolum subsp. capripneumoniae]QIN50017.1 MOLPALP family lipoprotein [Mycoplasma capricolum subsp. capripneumoniae]CDZ18381.1 putative lipoprotein [Mycoplasma capricolum subsp. capripneumoniae]